MLLYSANITHMYIHIYNFNFRYLRSQNRIKMHIHFFASLTLSCLCIILWDMLVHYDLFRGKPSNTVISRDPVSTNVSIKMFLSW